MIKKIQVEIALLFLLVVNIFLSHAVDNALYNYFFNLNYGYGSLYLKKFFIGITELGDSLWYFLIIISVLVFSYLGQKIKIITYKTWLFLKNVSLFSFFYLILVGLVTQILKHIIGRPRPNYVDFDIGPSFNFFSTDAIFHSFPSGHSSTIVAITLILCLLIPSLRVFFLLMGFVVALSRVVVGAHFTTDIIAGGLVAIILYRFFLIFLRNRYPVISVQNFKINNTSLLFKTNTVFFVAAVFVTVGFGLDIYISSLFYFVDSREIITIFGLKTTVYDYPKSYFLLQSYYSVSIIFRKVLLPILVVYIFILPIIGKLIPIKQIFFNHKFTYKEILFIWFSGILTLIVVVNGLLKDLWGRSRPNDIQVFGGNEAFTPWYRLGESCLSNCSFVSGDSSVGFAFIIFYFVTKKNIYIYLSILFGASLGFIRIIAGGHFFSDIVFSQIITTSIIFFSFFIYKRIF